MVYRSSNIYIIIGVYNNNIYNKSGSPIRKARGKIIFQLFISMSELITIIQNPRFSRMAGRKRNFEFGKPWDLISEAE